MKLRNRIACAQGARFKLWCNNNFKVERIEGLEHLYCRKTKLPILIKEEIFNEIFRAHQKVAHAKSRRTYDEMKKRFGGGGVNLEFVEMFVKTCPECSTRPVTRPPPAGQPIISVGYLTRVQMDLVHMS